MTKVIYTDVKKAKQIRISLQSDDDVEIGHVYLCVNYNDEHDEPFGLMEDVFVQESYRGQGYVQLLLDDLIALAKSEGCYKLIGTCRYTKAKVHNIYLARGFVDHGKEFRLDL